MNTKLKVFLALLLVYACLLSAVACNSSKDQADNSSDATEVMGESDGSNADNSYTDTDADGNPKRDPNYKPVNYDVMKGMWISQFDIASVYCSGSTQKMERSFESNVDKICKGLAEAGFNTAIIQVRPYGDSFFPSDVYPPSSVVVGAYGKEFKYDPFRIFVKAAHKYGLSVHAWINPMRLMKEEEITKISTDYRIGQWYQDETLRTQYMSTFEGRYYLLPGQEEARKLVCDGITELGQKYNIDAVHIDDYFYPTAKDAFDAAHYTQVKDEYLNLRDYRIQSVNKLVSDMYKAVKAVDEDMEFGISPAGSISNNITSLYADVNTWCSRDGFCDYIIPQVYWGFEYPTKDYKFDVCCQAWEAIHKNKNVKLIIGIEITDAKDINKAGNEEFKTHKDVIKRQLMYVNSMENSSGFAFFSYGTMFSPSSGNLTGTIKEERENFLPYLKDEFGK